MLRLIKALMFLFPEAMWELVRLACRLSPDQSGFVVTCPAADSDLSSDRRGFQLASSNLSHLCSFPLLRGQGLQQGRQASLEQPQFVVR